jgi:hypothetical protein
MTREAMLTVASRYTLITSTFTLGRVDQKTPTLITARKTILAVGHREFDETHAWGKRHQRNPGRGLSKKSSTVLGE